MQEPETKATVMVVDDSKTVRTLVSSIIEKSGHTSLTAADGDICIELINAHQIDLLLLDVNMPRKSGMEVLRYLRDHHFNIPVIMISGSCDIGQAVMALKLGAYDFLEKPVIPDKLLVTVKNALAEAELRKNLKLYSAAIAQTPLSIIITDTKGIIQSTNEAFSTISGYSGTSVIGRNISILKSGKHSNSFYKDLWDTITSGKPWYGELINKKSNGELFYEQTTISPINGNNDKISHFIGIQQDITEQKKKQAELALSEMRFHDMANLLPQTIFEINLEGRITYTNRMGFETFGFTKEDMENGVQAIMLFAPEDREKVRLNMKNRLEGIPFDDHEYTGRKNDGTFFPICVYSSRIIENETIAGIRGIVIDISDIKKAEEMVLELNRTLEQRVEERTNELAKSHQLIFQQEKLVSIGQLAAGIAHEINNPLNFITFNECNLSNDFNDLLEMVTDYREIIEKSVGVSADAEGVMLLRQKEKELDIDFLLENIPKALEMTRQGVARITAITRSMRNYSFTNQKGVLIPADINKAVNDALLIAKSEYSDVASVELQLQDLPEVVCDQSKISQVILNLIMNSAQAIKSQNRSVPGKITIKTWSTGESVFCSLSDDGPGMAEEVRSRVFEPFFTTKDVGEGTGLGLSISYDIVVNKHLGSIEAECPVEGGTVFSFSIPR